MPGAATLDAARLQEERQVTDRESALINIAEFLEFVMRSQHRVRINGHEQPVIWVLRRFMDYCCHLEISWSPFGFGSVSFNERQALERVT